MNHWFVRLSVAVGGLLFLTACGRTDGAKEVEWVNSLDPVVITTDSVATKAKSILLVIHEEGHGGWQFMDGGDVSGGKPRVIPKDELLKIDPTIKNVTDLPVGWEARRTSVSFSWVRRQR